MAREMKPVYIVNGFLESGKTEFINYTLEQPYFQIKGKTLLLICEEGEIEYAEDVLKKSRVEPEWITDKEDFTIPRLLDLEKKHKPERIIIEYNGMWNFKELELPKNWEIQQQITCIDASSFVLYYTNMKSLLAEMVRGSELIMFNRCDGIEDLASYKRNVKAVNPKAEIIFEDSQGEIDEIFEDDLPYLLTDDPIVLTSDSYGIWYLDAMDHMERYEGKKLEFVAQVLKPKNFPENYFVPGRLAMTCCAEDMTFLGYACEYSDAEALKQREWIKITCVANKEYFQDYGGEGPLLHALSVEKTTAPKNEIIGFN